MITAKVNKWKSTLLLMSLNQKVMLRCMSSECYKGNVVMQLCYMCTGFSIHTWNICKLFCFLFHSFPSLHHIQRKYVNEIYGKTQALNFVLLLLFFLVWNSFFLPLSKGSKIIYIYIRRHTLSFQISKISNVIIYMYIWPQYLLSQ